uniref:Uncharacterized protein n=1 Tax=Hyaloperonospora arabidopsidis (strain Emoy2) TaxID=559515 RepID=M4BCR6_HYAAE
MRADCRLDESGQAATRTYCVPESIRRTLAATSAADATTRAPQATVKPSVSYDEVNKLFRSKRITKRKLTTINPRQQRNILTTMESFSL